MILEILKDNNAFKSCSKMSKIAQMNEFMYQNVFLLNSKHLYQKKAISITKKADIICFTMLSEFMSLTPCCVAYVGQIIIYMCEPQKGGGKDLKSIALYIVNAQSQP